LIRRIGATTAIITIPKSVRLARDGQILRNGEWMKKKKKIRHKIDCYGILHNAGKGKITQSYPIEYLPEDTHPMKQLGDIGKW